MRRFASASIIVPKGAFKIRIGLVHIDRLGRSDATPRRKQSLAGGRWVEVAIEDYDKFGRAVGVVTCEGWDVGEWLVPEGHAFAAYSDRYKHVQREAREAKRGMWGHARNIDPRAHRHRKTD